MLSTFARVALGAFLALCTLAALACGGSGPAAVVRVGDTAVTKSEVAHWMFVMGSGRKLPPASTAHYRELRNQAVSFLITSAWILGEARTQGIRFSGPEVQRQIVAQQRRSFPGGGEAEFAEYLKQTGQTSADLALEARNALASAKLRQALLVKQPSVTDAEVASYYHLHLHSFMVPERRDVKITNRKSVGAVEELKREVQRGRAFAGVAQSASIERNPNADLGGTPDVDARLPIEQAIFHARPYVLTGPIRGRVDYFLFEVTKIHPAAQYSLAQVSHTIRSELNSERRARALAVFSAAWSRRWRGETTCQPGYVVAKCRQYKGNPGVTSLEGQAPLG